MNDMVWYLRLLAATTLAASAVVHARAATPATGSSHLPEADAARAAQVSEMVGELRSALADRTFAAGVRATFAAQGLVLPPPRLPRPEPETVRASLPRSVRLGVAGLDAAVRRAIEMLGPLSREDVESGIGVIAQHLGSLPDRARRSPVAHRMRPPGAAGRPSVVREFPGLMPAGRVLPASVRGALARNPDATLLIATALDAYLPALTALRPRASAGVAAEGCDMLDELPYLCVGSDADNTYTESTALLIDFGGDDSYSNSAGGAPFLPQDDALYLPVSVNVDLEGDDRYEDGPVVPVDRVNEIVTQGAGTVGAVGVAVDLEGNDTYSATAPVPQNVSGVPLAQSYVIAQGAGAYGTGFLFDDAGSDTYLALDRGHDWVVSSGVLAQGMGAAGNASGCTLYAATAPPFFGHPSCSLAALVDRGDGDDTYVLDATQRGTRPEYFRVAIGQGMGQNVAGILSDGGGTDSFAIRTEQGATGSNGLFGLSTAIPIGQGWAAGGLGVLLEGEGDTTYTIEATQRQVSWNYEVGGQGFGLAAGVGVLDDAGGDDSYMARSDLPQVFTFVVDDTCKQLDGTKCPRAKRSWIGNIGGPLSEVHAQGLAQGAASLGILRDHGGDDEYVADAAAHLDVRLEDRLTEPQAPAQLDVISFSAPLLWAQGYSTGEGSLGLLRDDEGSDSYTIRQLNDTKAAATSDHGGDPVLSAYSQFQSFVGGQGASLSGIGALLDLGGTGDRFVASADNPVQTSTGSGAYRWSGYWARLQGMGGRGVFRALGEGTVITTRPTNGVSLHSPDLHGAGRWLYDQPATLTGSPPGADAEHQVYDGAGYVADGHAPGATASTSRLAFLDETAAGGRLGETAPVAARLTDAAGEPLPGVSVRFTIQYGGGFMVPVLEEFESWNNALEVSAVTDEEGVARGELPIDVSYRSPAYPTQVFYISDISLYSFRLLATFDGGPGRYPAHETRAFQLQPRL